MLRRCGDGRQLFARRELAADDAVVVVVGDPVFFSAGQRVYELVAPTGSVYVIQSASQHVDPDNTVDRLATLGERLSLPQGWQYRTPRLEEDLVVRAEAGGAPAHIVFDEYEDNYQRIDNV